MKSVWGRFGVWSMGLMIIAVIGLAGCSGDEKASPPQASLSASISADIHNTPTAWNRTKTFLAWLLSGSEAFAQSIETIRLPDVLYSQPIKSYGTVTNTGTTVLKNVVLASYTPNYRSISQEYHFCQKCFDRTDIPGTKACNGVRVDVDISAPPCDENTTPDSWYWVHAPGTDYCEGGYDEGIDCTSITYLSYTIPAVSGEYILAPAYVYPLQPGETFTMNNNFGMRVGNDYITMWRAYASDGTVLDEKHYFINVIP